MVLNLQNGSREMADICAYWLSDCLFLKGYRNHHEQVDNVILALEIGSQTLFNNLINAMFEAYLID